MAPESKAMMYSAVVGAALLVNQALMYLTPYHLSAPLVAVGATIGCGVYDWRRLSLDKIRICIAIVLVMWNLAWTSERTVRALAACAEGLAVSALVLFTVRQYVLYLSRCKC